MRVVGEQRDRHVAGDFVERLLRGRCRPLRIPPAPPPQPTALADGPEPVPDASQRLLYRREALQPNLPLSDRPRREVDMRVREARDDAAPSEIDAFRAGQRHLVRPDPARDPVARDCERGRSRKRRLQRPHNASLENHGRESSFRSRRNRKGAAMSKGGPSFWIGTTPETDYPTLTDEIDVDVAVVGAGIAGITAAVLLKRAGKTVALLESKRIVHGATGYTTAKVTSGHGLGYTKIRKGFGEEGVRTYAQANEAALQRIAQFVEEDGIDCEFERRTNYVYAESEDEVAQLRQEAEVER